MKRKILAATAAACVLLNGCFGGIQDLDCNDHPEQCARTGPPPASGLAQQPDGSAPLPAYPPPPADCCPVC